MAATRTANAHWEGSLFEGKGRVSLDSSGVGSYDVSWAARTEESNGMTSPEELIAAAHSSCFSMAFANELSKAGHAVESIDTKAEVTFQPGKGITGSHLTTRASVPGISAEEFATIAETARTGCPVSGALTGTTITLDAALA
jgi:lipoyl-dependent peroxiredoxin